MNRLFGYFSFCSARLPLPNQIKFESPFWAPDHIGHFKDEYILLSSTQRFITPECHRALMPIHHHDSGYVLIADAYLTQRKRLCNQLNANIEQADAELILLAYLKWGHQVCQHLSGEFCFALWDPSDHSLFIATDQFNRRPLLYAYKAGHSFIFANEISPFRIVYASRMKFRNPPSKISCNFN